MGRGVWGAKPPEFVKEEEERRRRRLKFNSFLPKTITAHFDGLHAY